VKPLDEFAQHHPLATGSVGVLSSFLGWLLDHVTEINAVGLMLSTWIGIAVGGMTLALLIRKWRHGRAERAKHWQDVDDDMEFP